MRVLVDVAVDDEVVGEHGADEGEAVVFFFGGGGGGG